MDDQNQNKSNVLQFPRPEWMVDDYVISLHIRNMFATFGEEKVRAAFKELFEAPSSSNFPSFKDIIGFGD